MSREPVTAIIRLTSHAGARARWQFDTGHALLRADRAWPGFEPAPEASQEEIAEDLAFAAFDARASDLPAREVASAEGWLVDAVRRIRRVERNDDSIYDAAELGALRVTRDGARVALDPVAALGAAAEEWLLGVGLVQAFARRGVFCLHACAGLRGERLFAATGASGAGKSTLARAMGADARWSRVADDILPWDAATARAWPRCPQLKLAPSAWATSGAALPIACLLVMQPRGANAALGARLNDTEARRAVIAATAGARLFDAPLLQRHLDACTRFALRVPVRGLSVRDDAAATEACAREALELIDAA